MEFNKEDFNKNGYLSLKSLISEERINNIIDEIYIKNPHNMNDHRIQDIWKECDLIYYLAFDNIILNILEKIYDKKPIPFQTLNFYKGTQQRLHSDQIHFCSEPENYMCGLWIALEDITMENGPLIYYPGSHKMEFKNMQKLNLNPGDYVSYENKINEIINESNFQPEYGIIKKGDAILWHANLIHGGYPIINKNLSRMSIVIHYFFEDTKYWTPLHSTPEKIIYRDKSNFIKKNILPYDFNVNDYRNINKDLENLNDEECEKHYLKHGFKENRQYK